jgi:hypothetical protein
MSQSAGGDPAKDDKKKIDDKDKKDDKKDPPKS